MNTRRCGITPGAGAGAQRWLPHLDKPSDCWAEPCRCAAGDHMAIYLVGSAVPGLAAWGSGKGASMEQGNLPRARALPTSLLMSNPVCPAGYQGLCVPPAPQHCHPLSPPRCKDEHWDGQSSRDWLVPRTGPAPWYSISLRWSHPSSGTFCGLRDAGRCLNSKTRVSRPPANSAVCGPAAGMPWTHLDMQWPNACGHLFASLCRVPGLMAAVA